MRIFIDRYINLDKVLLEDVENDKYIISNVEDKKHILLVMRKGINDLIEVVDLNNKVFEAKIVNVEPLMFHPIKEIPNTDSKIQIDIYQGLPKFDKMEYIIEKATELGVENIYPLVMDRSVVKLKEQDIEKKIERWNKISKSAAEQSKRNLIPKVQIIKGIKEIDFGKYDLNLFLDVETSEHNISLEGLKNKEGNKQDNKEDNKEENIKRISVVIGPEGGFSDFEREYLLEKSNSINLGKRVLRTETASIVILSLLQYLFGDF